MIVVSNFETPVGELIIGDYNNSLCICDWKYRKQRSNIDQRIKNYLKLDFVAGNTPLIDSTKQQLQLYFEKKLTIFNIPLMFCGTDFQKNVWQNLQSITYGSTETYLSLSKKINNVKAIRAVASANGANAISIIVPCHRVIGNKGELVGYAGGLHTKKKLLFLESVNKQTELFS